MLAPGKPRARRGFTLLLKRFRFVCAFAITTVVLSLAATSLLTSQNSVHAATAPCTVQFGMYEPNAPWDPNMTAMRALDTAIGRHSSIVHYYSQWADNGSGTFAANQPWMLNAIRNYTSVGVTGATPLLTWEAWGPAPMRAANNTFPLTAIAAGSFDPYIDSWANGLKTYGGPMVLDFRHWIDRHLYPLGFRRHGH